eukprot:jgi/Mesvir1/15489/Mv25876-RA.1
MHPCADTITGGTLHKSFSTISPTGNLPGPIVACADPLKAASPTTALRGTPYRKEAGCHFLGIHYTDSEKVFALRLAQ